MTDIAIRVSNLSKCYQIYDNPRDRLKQFVVPKLCRSIPPLRKLFTVSHLPLTTRNSPGFAHGFVVLSDTAEFLYKTTDYWFPEHERGIVWNDLSLAIDWKLQEEPVLSGKDRQGQLFHQTEAFY